MTPPFSKSLWVDFFFIFLYGDFFWRLLFVLVWLFTLDSSLLRHVWLSLSRKRRQITEITAGKMKGNNCSHFNKFTFQFWKKWVKIGTVHSLIHRINDPIFSLSVRQQTNGWVTHQIPAICIIMDISERWLQIRIIFFTYWTQFPAANSVCYAS